MKKAIQDFEVIKNQRVNDSCFVLHLRCSAAMLPVMPGQFAEVLVPGTSEVYLRRPISIYDTDTALNQLSLLIKIAGKGTLALSRLKEGEIVNLVYPLGNTFTLPSGKNALLVGGGVGIAPMLLLAKKLHSLGFKPDVLIGGRTAADIPEPEKYRTFADVYLSTEDHSAGEKGFVTSHSVLNSGINRYSIIYACGPNPMMKAVSKIAAAHGIACEVSLEHMMACGIGACLCCVVETTGGNRTTCVDGPVFDTRKLKSW